MSSFVSRNFTNAAANQDKKINSQTLIVDQSKEIDSIYKSTIDELLSMYPLDTFTNPDKPSDKELDKLDSELDKAIFMLSSTTRSSDCSSLGSIHIDELDEDHGDKRFSDIESFLLKYQ